MIQQPIKATPAPAEDTRELTEPEMKFYRTMKDHYMERCLAEPCNRGLRQQMKAYLAIVESGRIGTLAAYARDSDCA